MVKSMAEAGSFLALAVNTNTQENDTSKCYICNKNEQTNKQKTEQKEGFRTKLANLNINSNNSNQ